MGTTLMSQCHKVTNLRVGCSTVLTDRRLQKSAELVLKIGPIGGLNFGGVKKMSYLCIAIGEVTARAVVNGDAHAILAQR